MLHTDGKSVECVLCINTHIIIIIYIICKHNSHFVADHNAYARQKSLFTVYMCVYVRIDVRQVCCCLMIRMCRTCDFNSIKPSAAGLRVMHSSYVCVCLCVTCIINIYQSICVTLFLARCLNAHTHTHTRMSRVWSFQRVVRILCTFS